MKTTKYSAKASILFTMLLGMFFSIALTSCGDDDDENGGGGNGQYNERIIGSWEAYHQTGHNSNGDEWDEDMSIYTETTLLTFRTDGTGTATSYFMGNADFTEDFSYSISARNISLNFSDGTEVAEILVLTPMKLVVKSESVEDGVSEENTIFFKATLNN